MALGIFHEAVEFLDRHDTGEVLEESPHATATAMGEARDFLITLMRSVELGARPPEAPSP